jgi:hypothetical protein
MKQTTWILQTTQSINANDANADAPPICYDRALLIIHVSSYSEVDNEKTRNCKKTPVDQYNKT